MGLPLDDIQLSFGNIVFQNYGGIEVTLSCLNPV